MPALDFPPEFTAIIMKILKLFDLLKVYILHAPNLLEHAEIKKITKNKKYCTCVNG